MSGCGVRSQRRWDKQRGFKKNKNKIKTSLSRGFKESCHIHEQLLKKVQSLPILFWVQPEVQKGSDGWLGSGCSLKKERKKKFQFPVMPFVPDHMAAPLEGKAFSPLRRGSNSGFIILQSRLRETESSPSLSEIAGRVKPWNAINCSNWSLARTPKLATYI